MNQPARGAVLIEQQTRALLDLVEADRQRQCAQILGEANSRVAALRAQANAEARARMVQAFEEQRLRRRERIAAGEARLATQRRLNEQQRIAALLLHAWQQLPGELSTLWQEPATRAAWVTQVLAWARARMPPGPWRIVHAPDWRPAEHEEVGAEPGAAHRFEADPAIAAGLKIVADCNVIDGTLEGVLADRADFEARLLRGLEAST